MHGRDSGRLRRSHWAGLVVAAAVALLAIAIADIEFGNAPGSSQHFPPIFPNFRPPTVDPGEVPDELALCQARVQNGLQVVFTPKAEMIEGQAHEVGAAVALVGTPMPSLPGGGSTPTTLDALDDPRCTLDARLTGANFDIDPPETVRQSFLAVDSLEWSWVVTPQIDGDLTLRLIITPIAHLASGPSPAANYPFIADIEVDARGGPSLWGKLNDFFGEPIPGAILGVALAGLSVKGGLVAVRKWRRKRPPADAVTPDEADRVT